MIARVRGILLGVEEDQALVENGGLTYGVHIGPAVAEILVSEGRVGEEITLYTLHYIEGGVGMGSLTPRLVGFLSRNEREFFGLLTSVQGLGVRKALRSMAISASDYARAIEMDDLATLRRLPEIGNKTAQKIVMELRGKVTAFAHLRDEEIAAVRRGPVKSEEYQEEAYLVLLQLQYSDSEARELVDRVSRDRPDITTSDALIQEVFRRQKK